MAFRTEDHHAMIARSSGCLHRHCERSEAIHLGQSKKEWIASTLLAMTGGMRKASRKGLAHVRTASDRSRDIPQGHPAGPHRPGAGVLQRARRQGAPDLETDRAGAKRLRADADADHQ